MSAFQLTPNHIASKRRVGDVEGLPVFEVATTGGLHMVLVGRKGKFEQLGAGPHQAIAMHLAQKVEPKIRWTELAKSEQADPRDFADMLPESVELTRRLRRLQGF